MRFATNRYELLLNHKLLGYSVYDTELYNNHNCTLVHLPAVRFEKLKCPPGERLLNIIKDIKIQYNLYIICPIHTGFGSFDSASKPLASDSLDSLHEVSVNIITLSKPRNRFLASINSHAKNILFICFGYLFISQLWGSELSHTIATVKPAIVGIGTFNKTRSPPVKFMGTGFAVGDGLNVITNAHVIPEVIDRENKETLGIISGSGENAGFRTAVPVAIDKEHDLVKLKISGAPLQVMEFGDSDTVQEGQSLAFTGFPIGMILGFHPVTHNAMVSSITPVVIPALNSAKLSDRMISQLQKSAYSVFQLDGTAYPGNSGSPLYDPGTGAVYGVINMVFVKGLKEAALSQPSGITYAIPGNFVRELLQRKQP